MPLTKQEYQKIGDALATQLESVLGVADPTDTTSRPTASQEELRRIQDDFQSEVLPLIRSFVGELKAGGHIPAGKDLSEAVIVVA